MSAPIVWDEKEEALLASRMISSLAGLENPSPLAWEQAYRKAQINLPPARRKTQHGWRNEFSNLRDLVEEAMEKQVPLPAAIVEPVGSPLEPPSIAPAPAPAPATESTPPQSEPEVSAPAPTTLKAAHEHGFYSEDAEIMYHLLQEDLKGQETRIVDQVCSRLEPLLEFIGDKLDPKIGKEFRKLMGRPTTRVCIYNVEGKMAVNYREKLADLPITVEFLSCDQKKVIPDGGMYDLIVYTREGDHGAWEGLKKMYPKEKLIFCDGGITRVVEAIRLWLTKKGVVL